MYIEHAHTHAHAYRIFVQPSNGIFLFHKQIFFSAIFFQFVPSKTPDRIVCDESPGLTIMESVCAAKINNGKKITSNGGMCAQCNVVFTWTAKNGKRDGEEGKEKERRRK